MKLFFEKTQTFKMKGYLVEMISRLSLRNIRSTLAPGGHRSVSEKASPVEVAAQMRLTGPTRIQDHDYLHVFEATEKPKISGPLAIGKILFFINKLCL